MTLLGDRCVGVVLWVFSFRSIDDCDLLHGVCLGLKHCCDFPLLAFCSYSVCGVALGGLSEACVIAAAGHRAPKWSVVVFGKSYCAKHARSHVELSIDGKI